MKSKNAVAALIIILVLTTVAAAQSTPASSPDKNFSYYVVLLLRPANLPQLAPDARQKLQEAHLANIRRLAKEGKLVLAGPFLDDTPLRGIFVLKAKSLDEAKQWTATDPAVQGGRLQPEFHVWAQPESVFGSPPESSPMQDYALVLYNKGDNFKPLHAPDTQTVVPRHLRFVKNQEETGKLVIGGPFKDGSGKFLGLLIFATTPEEASGIVAQDPLVLSGEAKPEVHSWMTQKGVLRK